MASEDQFGPPKRLVTSLEQFDPQVLESMAQWMEQRGFRTPVSNLVGFGQFLAQNATSVIPGDNTLSTTYVDLSTVGPSLTGLADGNYIVMFGCTASAAVGEAAVMSISVNAVAASDNDSCRSDTANLVTGTSIMRAVPKRCAAGGNNSIVTKYRSAFGASVHFGNRWMFAIRYANL